MFIDINCTQEKKYNQNAFGDYFISKRRPGRLIAVLSDGLGSGIKANILSTMTATMLLRFIEAQRNIRSACETILNSLPVCQVRQISYSTFSAIDCKDDGDVRIVEEGNPQFIWMKKNGEVIEPECKIINSKTFSNRHMKIYHIKLELGDRLIFCSDGVTQAGLGGSNLKLGLRRKGLIDVIKNKLKHQSDISSRELSKYIVEYAKYIDNKQAKDDISACVVHFAKLRKLCVFTGPPYHAEKDSEYAKIFDEFDGKKAICGGTTANLISRELNREIITESPFNTGKLPACSSMEGVNLITEGILTLSLAYEYLKDEESIDEINAATRLMNLLLDNDYILFMVGAQLNQAHYDPNLPIEIEIRKNVIKKMKKVLEEKYTKRVEIQYM